MGTEILAWNQMLTTTRTGYGNGGTPVSRNELAGSWNYKLRVNNQKRISVNTLGYNNPKRGRLNPNPFTFELDVVTNESGYVRTFTPKLKYPQYGSVDYTIVGVQQETPRWANFSGSAPQVLDSGDLSMIANRANSKILSKLKNQKFNLAVATAEASRTMSMIGDTAIRIASALHDLKHGDIAGAARTLGVKASRRVKRGYQEDYIIDRARAMSNGWLELQYGWKPLLSDVYGACEELATKGNQGITSTVRTKQFIGRTYNAISKPTSKQWIVHKGSALTSVQYSITYYRALGATNDLVRLGITNPLEVAWELVPYSFVIDWFLPIGSWLGNLDATLGLTFINGFKTTFQKLDVTQQWIYGPDLSLSQTSEGTTSSAITRVRCYRTILTDFPSPMAPQFKNPLSYLHMANGLALLNNFMHNDMIKKNRGIRI